MNSIDCSSTEVFLEQVLTCIHECLQNIQEGSKKNHIEKRLKYHVQCFKEILLYSDQKQFFGELKVVIRNLVLTLVYFNFGPLIEKHFFQEVSKHNTTKEIYIRQNDSLKFEITSLFIQYYDKCIICRPFLKIISDIDHNFTSNIYYHFEYGTKFVPCISLFRNCENDNNEEMTKNSWMYTVFNFLTAYNPYVCNRLKEIFDQFSHEFKYDQKSKCIEEFFCTVLIPILDDLDFINCLEDNYEFLVSLLQLFSAMIGKPKIIYNNVMKKPTCHNGKYFQYIFKKLDTALDAKLFSNCYDLIALKLPNNDFDSIQPSSLLVAKSPALYQYDKWNKPGCGILSQLFSYASGVELNINHSNALLVAADSFLLCLPLNGKTLK